MDLAVAERDLADVRQLAFDETSRACGHHYLMLAADAERRAVIFVTEGRDAATADELAGFLREQGCDPGAIDSCSTEMSPAFIDGVGDHLTNA